MNELARVRIAPAAAARDEGSDAMMAAALTDAEGLHHHAVVLVADREYRGRLCDAVSSEYIARAFFSEAEREQNRKTFGQSDPADALSRK